MRTAVRLLIIGFIVMAAGIAYALIFGEFFSEAKVLFRYPWFHLSMIDLYIGFLLFCGWVLYRERSPVIASAWIISVLLLGNLASCLYAIIAARRANGNWQSFWMGARTPSSNQTS